MHVDICMYVDICTYVNVFLYIRIEMYAYSACANVRGSFEMLNVCVYLNIWVYLNVGIPTRDLRTCMNMYTFLYRYMYVCK